MLYKERKTGKKRLRKRQETKTPKLKMNKTKKEISPIRC